MKAIDLLVLQEFLNSEEQKLVTYDLVDQNKKVTMSKRPDKKVNVTFNLVVSQHFTDVIPLGVHDTAIKLLYVARLMGCTYYKVPEPTTDPQMVDATIRKQPGIQRAR